MEYLKDYCDPRDDASAYYYFDFNDISKQDAGNFLASIIAQLSSQMNSIPSALKELYDRCKAQHRASMDELKETFYSIAKTFRVKEGGEDSGQAANVFIVIDALDECPAGSPRDSCLELLTEFNSWSLPNLHLLVTSRREPDIEAALISLTPSIIPIHDANVGVDIGLHISRQLEKDPKLNQWPDNVKAQIQDTLMAEANGM